jgi:hypothetical protein
MVIYPHSIPLYPSLTHRSMGTVYRKKSFLLSPFSHFYTSPQGLLLLLLVYIPIYPYTEST